MSLDMLVKNGLFEDKSEKNNLFIEEGMRLDVMRTDDDVVFLGRVRTLDGTTLTLVNDTGGDVPHVLYGAEVKLRGAWPGVGLVTYHGTVFGSTETMWKIGDLEEWYGWERRSFYRQDVSVEAQVLRTYRASAVSEQSRDVRVDCRLLDVSARGVLLSCSKAVFMQGDRLRVTNAYILPDESPFSFDCTVLRVERARFNNNYGCQFEGLTIREEDRLARAVFMLQQRERNGTLN